MSERKAREVEYLDPEGNSQTGWYLDGHVYQDEAATIPISVGSTFRANSGKYYRMTPYGGVLWSSPDQLDQNGSWVPQGNHWYRTAQDLVEKLGRRPEFSYDPEQDPLWQGTKNQYVREGRRAMEDTLGRASGLTGGYASTYAQNLGQQAYDDHLTQLSRLLPEFYDRARKSYDSQTRDMLDRLSAVTGLYDQDYQTYLDLVKRNQWERSFEAENSHWDQEFALDREKFQADQHHWYDNYLLDREKFEASMDQWAKEYGLDREKFEAAKDQWAQQYGLDRDKFEAAERQWAQEFGLSQEKFREAVRQWNQSFDAENDRWAQEFRLDREKFQASMDQWAQEFGLSREKFQEAIRQWAEEFGESRDRWERSFQADNQHWSAEYEQAFRQWLAQQAERESSRESSTAANDRSYAYRMAMLALQQGLRVSDDLLQAAGIDPSYAETIRRWYASHQ